MRKVTKGWMVWDASSMRRGGALPLFHVMPAEGGESLYDRGMKEVANWDGLRFRDCSTSVKLPARIVLIKIARMRGMAIVILFFFALAIALPRARQFTTLPTKPMPAVNVPDK
jgi:hypothetical protein